MYNYFPSVHMISIILGMDLITECNYYNDRPFLYTFSVLNKKNLCTCSFGNESHIAALLTKEQDFS